MHERLEPGRNHIAVDALVFTVKDGALTLLLAKRSGPPCADRWALPGRLVGLEESAETVVCRLLHEMLPVGHAYMEQLYTFTALDRDPRGRVVSIAYMIIVPWERLKEALRQESVQLRCFRVKLGAEGLRLTGADGAQLMESDLAFDHGAIIRTGVTRLQGKIDYTEVGFHFLNDTSAFSLSELQAVFEAVQGRAADSSNFRRWVRRCYEETGRIVQTAQARQQGRGRPAVLYRFVRQEAAQ